MSGSRRRSLAWSLLALLVLVPPAARASLPPGGAQADEAWVDELAPEEIAALRSEAGRVTISHGPGPTLRLSAEAAPLGLVLRALGRHLGTRFLVPRRLLGEPVSLAALPLAPSSLRRVLHRFDRTTLWIGDAPRRVHIVGTARRHPGSDGVREGRERRLELADVATLRPREQAVVRAEDEIWERLRSGETLDLIVTFDDPDLVRQLRSSRDPRGRRLPEMRLAYEALVRSTLGALGAEAPPLVELYPYTRIARLRIASEGDLVRLLRHPRVVAAELSRSVERLLADSLPQIHQPTAVSSGRSALGTAIAVIDGAVDWENPAFGGCAPPGAIQPPTCRIRDLVDCRTPDPFTTCGPDPEIPPDRHGTHVAAIAGGVAPGANLLAINVFPEGRDSMVLRGLSWVLANAAGYNVVAVNLSLGGKSLHGGPCSSAGYQSAFSDLWAVGIAPVVASGNDAAKTGIASPACVPGAIAVGSVDVGDGVSGFSNSAPKLALLAPGEASPGQGIRAGGLSSRGTSMAAPHVAGALALLRAPGAFPEESVQQSVDRLASTGVPVTDPGNGLTRPRIDLAAALGLRAAPLGVDASDGGSTQYVEVAWTGSGPFRVFRAPADAPGSRVQISPGPVGSTFFRDTAAEPGRRYVYGVTSDLSDPPGVVVEDVGFRALGVEASIAEGDGWFLLRRGDGRVYTWGVGGANLGQGDDSSPFPPTVTSPRPAVNPDGSPFEGIRRIAATRGSRLGLAIDLDGGLWAWGFNVCGPICGIGDGTLATRFHPVPIAVPGGRRVRDVGSFVDTFTGTQYLAVGEDGALVAWLLDADTGLLVPEVLISGGIRRVATGGRTHLLVTESGDLLSFGGDPGNPELGRDGPPWPPASVQQFGEPLGGPPPPLTDLGDVVDVVAGGSYMAALLSNGAVYVWGRNRLFAGPTVIGTAGVLVDENDPIPRFFDAVQLAGGGNALLARRADGSVWAWGSNRHGALGDGTTTSRDEPAPVLDETGTPLSDIVHVAANGGAAIAVKADGTLYMWGDTMPWIFPSPDTLLATPLVLDGRPAAADPTSVDLAVTLAGAEVPWPPQELVAVDLEVAGDEKITRDPRRGLDWLDLQESEGLSYDETLGELLSRGWRHATRDELCDLLERFAVRPETCPDRGHPPGADLAAFQQLLGSAADGTALVSEGLYDDDTANAAVGLASLRTSAGGGLATLEDDALAPAEGRPGLGHWLVRDTPVEERAPDLSVDFTLANDGEAATFAPEVEIALPDPARPSRKFAARGFTADVEGDFACEPDPGNARLVCSVSRLDPGESASGTVGVSAVRGTAYRTAALARSQEIEDAADDNGEEVEVATDLDADADDVPGDGDGSGEAGDLPCRGGATDGCDDNCPVPNPDQADRNEDGIGDACQCGDATGDGRVDARDARAIQRCAIGLSACPALCDADGDGECTAADARRVQRFAVGALAGEDLACAERGGPP